MAEKSKKKAVPAAKKPEPAKKETSKQTSKPAKAQNDSSDFLPEIINSKNREKAGPTAPPEGLYLNKVFY